MLSLLLWLCPCPHRDTSSASWKSVCETANEVINGLFVCLCDYIHTPLVLIKDISADLARPHPSRTVYTADSHNAFLAEGCGAEALQ